MTIKLTELTKAMRSGAITPAEARRAHDVLITADPVVRDLRNQAWARVVAGEVDAAASKNLVVLNAGGGSDETEIKIYDVIDSWGGFWGISAADVGQALEEVTTSRIKLRINSPGGEVHEAVAIYNLFVDHPADVHVSIDSMAASAASFIAMAGDRITMNRGAEMMIHEAWGYAGGRAADMRDYADTLDRQTSKIAKIYEARAGGGLDGWLEAMAAETWYDADEAIEAGLADDKIALKGNEDDDSSSSENARDAWDLSIYNYSGRAEAPDPVMPAAEISTDEAPEAAPDVPAAPVAADVRAAARQRRAVDVARARLALA